MKSLVPPAPVAAQPSASDEKRGSLLTAPKATSPLDADFLRRVYRSMLWFSIVATILAAFSYKNNPAALGSFVGGLVLAAVMLRVQEVSVRSMLRPASEMAGFDAKMLVVLLLPLKFLAIGGVLFAASSQGVLKPGPLALGFFAGQLVLIAKFVGWFIVRATAKK